MEKTKVKTPFEQELERGKTISVNGTDVAYAIYAMAIHKRDLSLWSKGIKISRYFKVTDYKKYYGIKGANGQAVLDNFMILYNKHHAK